MTATILRFPAKPTDTARLALVGGAIESAIPLPCPDAELQLLIQIADKLVDNLRDYARPDCRGLIDQQLDNFIARVDQWGNGTA